MSKILFSIILSIFMLSLVFAQQGVHEDGTGLANPDLKESNQGTGLGLEDQNTDFDYVIQKKNANEPMQIENIVTENGEQLQIQIQDKNQLKLKVGTIIANTNMIMTQEQTQLGRKLKVQLSNGMESEIKVMPDMASVKALERLQLKVCSEDNNCSIELKEVGNGEQIKAVYELKVEKQSRVFGLFKAQMQVQAQVDAATGELIQTKKPWWAFLATESQELNEFEENLICCKSYGYGTLMEKVSIKYEFMNKEDCSVPENLIGGNKEIVDNSFCEAPIEE